MKLEDQFFGLLKSYEVGKDCEYTHVCFGPPFGRYNIQNNTEFMELYKQMAALHPDVLHLNEKQQNVGPLLIDLDFRFDHTHDKRQYNLTHIKMVVEVMTGFIKTYLPDTGGQMHEAFVLEKDKPTYDPKTNTYKDGFHVQYPNLPIDKYTRYVFTMLLRLYFKDTKSLNSIPFTNTIDDIIDEAVIYKNGWMMYMSRKHECDYRYIVTYLFDSNMNELKTDHLPTSELSYILSIRGYDDNSDAYTVPDELRTREFTDLYNKALQVFDKVKVKSKLEITQNIGGPTDKNIEGLVNLFSEARATNYNTWIQVCWALYNTNPNLYPIFSKFSQKCIDKYDENECSKVWLNSKRVENGFSLSSIYWWARQDNPEGYAEHLRKIITPALIKAESGTHHRLAIVLYEMYNHVFKCTSIKHKTWYAFEGNTWREIDGGFKLKNIMSTELAKEFCVLSSSYLTESGNKDGIEREKCVDKSNKLRKIVNNLETTAFKESLLSECCSLFYDTTFCDKLDTNLDLIGFNNGVYDLLNGCFRKGTPDDMVTLTTGYDYIEYEETHEHILGIKDFFNKIMPDPEMQRYLFLLLASYIEGHNKLQKFVIWTGSGSNGKSSLVDLISHAFGQYYDTLPNTVLTQKRGSSSSATPEMANKRGVRFVVLQEPEESDKMHVGYMKELTGSDWITARALYKEPIRFKPQFKLVLTCNRLPHIPSNDGGTWRRLRVTKFDSEFVDHPKNPNQFKKDYTLAEKLREWRQAFMWILINIYYPQYKKDGVPEPIKVTEHTEKYQKECDLYMEFICTSMVITNQPNDKIETKLAYELFKDWYKYAYPPPNKCPARKELLEYLRTKGLKVSDTFICGIKIAQND